MAVQVTPHPSWVADLDTTLEPSRQAILDTPVIIDASENQLVDGRIQGSSSPTTFGSSGGTTRCGGPWETGSTCTRSGSRNRSR